MIQDNQDGTKEQFYPITHLSAIEGLDELDPSEEGLRLLQEIRDSLTAVYKNIDTQYPFKNKYYGALGDSTTSGTRINGVVYTWTDYIKKYTQLEKITNFGRASSRITKVSDRTDSFYERCSSIQNQDIVSIFGGVNDFNYNSPLGTFKDSVETTFYGSLKKIIQTIVTNNSNAKLFLVTPMKTNQVNDTFSKNELGLTLLDYVNAMKEVADYYSIPVLNLYAESGISPYLSEQRALFMNDGTHLNEQGQIRLATRIAAFINTL